MEHHLVDRGAIFSATLDRQHLRREARLPLLDVQAEYRRAVERAEWQDHVERHHDRVRTQVFDDLRQRLGREPVSAGGRWAVAAMTRKALADSFEAR